MFVSGHVGSFEGAVTGLVPQENVSSSVDQCLRCARLGYFVKASPSLTSPASADRWRALFPALLTTSIESEISRVNLKWSLHFVSLFGPLKVENKKRKGLYRAVSSEELVNWMSFRCGRPA